MQSTGFAICAGVGEGYLSACDLCAVGRGAETMSRERGLARLRAVSARRDDAVTVIIAWSCHDACHAPPAIGLRHKENPNAQAIPAEKIA